MPDPTVVTVGEYTYEVTRLPAMQAHKWRIRLAKLLAPLIKELGKSAEGGGSLLDVKVNIMAGLTGGVASIIEALADDDATVTDLLGLATVRYGKGEDMRLTPAGIDLHFIHKAPLDDLYLVALEVIKTNDFLPQRITGVLGEFGQQATS
jgi:hypothetical protein